MTATHVFQRSHVDKILEILDKQDPATKYIFEFEDHKHSLNFLDINFTNDTTNKKCEFKGHPKDAITIIHIKPISCIDPSITKIIFKGFLYQALVICSEKQINPPCVLPLRPENIRKCYGFLIF